MVTTKRLYDRYMTKEQYKEYLRSEHWQKIRGDIYEARKRCEFCGGKKWLNIHHLSYERLGNELPTDLVVLCKLCHFSFHNGNIPKNFLQWKYANKRGKKEIAKQWALEKVV